MKFFCILATIALILFLAIFAALRCCPAAALSGVVCAIVSPAIIVVRYNRMMRETENEFAYPAK